MQVATKDKATWKKKSKLILSKFKDDLTLSALNFDALGNQFSSETMINLGVGTFTQEGCGRPHSKEKPCERGWMISNKKVSTRGLHWEIKL